MKTRTLIADRLYFGLDPLRLRAATARTLARVVGLAPERARLSATNLRHDFAVDTVQGTALVDELVAEGLLDPPTGALQGYGLTADFFDFATARIVEPLPRAKAKMLVAEAVVLAERINEDDLHNPLRITALAVHGDYMSRAQRLAASES